MRNNNHDASQKQNQQDRFHTSAAERHVDQTTGDSARSYSSQRAGSQARSAPLPPALACRCGNSSR